MADAADHVRWGGGGRGVADPGQELRGDPGAVNADDSASRDAAGGVAGGEGIGDAAGGCGGQHRVERVRGPAVRGRAGNGVQGRGYWDAAGAMDQDDVASGSNVEQALHIEISL